MSASFPLRAAANASESEKLTLGNTCVSSMSGSTSANCQSCSCRADGFAGRTNSDMADSNATPWVRAPTLHVPVRSHEPGEILALQEAGRWERRRLRKGGTRRPVWCSPMWCDTKEHDGAACCSRKSSAASARQDMPNQPLQPPLLSHAWKWRPMLGTSIRSSLLNMWVHFSLPSS